MKSTIQCILSSGLILAGMIFSLAGVSSCSKTYKEVVNPDPVTAQVDADSVLSYFNVIALKSEFGSSGDQRVKKWVEPIRIFMMGEDIPFLEKELDRVIAELNELMEPVRMYRVSAEDSANFKVFLGDGPGYVEVEPNVADYVGSNWGFTWIYWNGNKEIYKGSMYVDVVRNKEKNALKHILREELTQAMGLLNDSYIYDNSIFYQGWTSTIDYAEIDRKVIRLLYHQSINANMTADQVAEAYQDIELE